MAAEQWATGHVSFRHSVLDIYRLPACGGAAACCVVPTNPPPPPDVLLVCVEGSAEPGPRVALTWMTTLTWHLL
jgi:hypothetical protein